MFPRKISLGEEKVNIVQRGWGGGRGVRAAFKNAIVESYTAILPSVQRKLLFEQIHVSKKISLGEEKVNIVQRGWTGGGEVEGAGSFQECYS